MTERSDTPIETAMAAVAAQLALLKRGDLAALSRQADVPHSTLRDMTRPDWRPVAIRNLIAVERAIDTLTSDQPEARP